MSEKNQLRNVLTSDEAKELAKCEALIAVGFRTFYEVGSMLLKISDERLYRQTHSTFEHYCKERWQMSARKAYRLCEAAGVGKLIDAANASNLTQTPLPKPESESSARVLAHLEPGEVVEVWKEATKDGNQPTTEQLEKVVDKKVKPKPEPAENVLKESIGDELAEKMRWLAAKKDRESIKGKIQKHLDTWISDKYKQQLAKELREIADEIDPSNLIQMKATA